jgi:hypothetical protein
VPLDYLCPKLDGSAARALALDSILTHSTDNRAAPLKPAGYGRPRRPLETSGDVLSPY